MFKKRLISAENSPLFAGTIRIIALALALLMLFSCCTFAEGGSCGANAEWMLDDNGVLTIYGSGTMADYENEQAPWYHARASINTVIIEHGITAVGSASFYGFTNLTSVKVPNTVTSIGAYAFYECASLVSIALPSVVSEIGEYAFYNCASLKSMTETKNHTLEIIAAVEPTCTEPGLTEGARCSECGEILISQKTIAPADHIIVIDEATEPTCTENGYTEGSHCEVCGEILIEQTAIPSTGHKPVIDAGTEPTCTQTGLTEGSHCEVCAETIAEQTLLPMLDHVAGEWIVVEEATYEAEGLKEKRCTACETVLETEVIPMLEAEDKRTPGDVNSDGVVDGRDLIRLARHLGGLNVEIDASNASVNGDEIVDGRDLIRLARYLGGLNVELE